MVINSDGYFGFLAKQSACLLGGVFSNGYSTNAVTISFMRLQIWVAKAVFKYLHYFTILAILLPYKCIFALNSENCLNFNL